MCSIFSRLFSLNRKDSIKVKIAAYDNMNTLPRIEEIVSYSISQIIPQASKVTYDIIKQKGGSIPFIVINELIENLIHADFKEATISIFPDGNTVNISDQGPGISDKKNALLPGYSTASKKAKKYIRGVGSGLPIAHESIKHLGGTLIINDNLNTGSVITITLGKSLRNNHNYEKENGIDMENNSRVNNTKDKNVFNDKEKYKDVLSERQKNILLLLGDSDEIGPSNVAEQLKVSLSTAYRDLVTLENHELIQSLENGKRKLTPKGITFLSEIFK